MAPARAGSHRTLLARTEEWSDWLGRGKGLYSCSRLIYGYYISSYVIRDHWTVHRCHCMCVRMCVRLLSVWGYGVQGAEGIRRKIKPEKRKAIHTEKMEDNEENKNITPLCFELFSQFLLNSHSQMTQRDNAIYWQMTYRYTHNKYLHMLQ